jgi:hypothetical protein
VRFVTRSLALLLALLIYYVLRYRPKPELFVVPAIILLLLTLATPYVLSQREKVQRQHHLDKFRQLGHSLHSYYDTHQRFPTVATPKPQTAVVAPRPQPVIRPHEQSEELISPL